MGYLENLVTEIVQLGGCILAPLTGLVIGYSIARAGFVAALLFVLISVILLLVIFTNRMITAWYANRASR
jgi:hypothetical protein